MVQAGDGGSPRTANVGYCMLLKFLVRENKSDLSFQDVTSHHWRLFAQLKKQPSIKCTCTNDNNTARPFPFFQIRLRLSAPEASTNAPILPQRLFSLVFYHIKQISKMWFESWKKLKLKGTRRRDLASDWGSSFQSQIATLLRPPPHCPQSLSCKPNCPWG